MARIVKKSVGEAAVVVTEEYINEEAAQEGLHPETTKADVTDFKVHSVTYKLKELIKNDWVW